MKYELAKQVEYLVEGPTAFSKPRIFPSLEEAEKFVITTLETYGYPCSIIERKVWFPKPKVSSVQFAVQYRTPKDDNWLDWYDKLYDSKVDALNAYDNSKNLAEIRKTAQIRLKVVQKFYDGNSKISYEPLVQ